MKTTMTSFALLLAVAMTTACTTTQRERLGREWDRVFGRDKPDPAVPANPAPPPPTPPPVVADPLELPAGAHWIHGKNIEHWPQIFTLRDVVIHPAANGIHHHVTLIYSGLQEVPAWNVPDDPNNVHNVNGNAWVVREYDGQWYIGTFEYLRVGQATKEMAASPAWKLEPQPGDRIGFMISTLARASWENGTVADGITYQGRSAIFWTTWP